MTTFAIVMLSIILIASHHLYNWMVRAIIEEAGNEENPLIIFLSIILITLTLVCGYYIIIWTYPLLQQ